MGVVTTSKAIGEETDQQSSHQQVKSKNKRAHKKGRTIKEHPDKEIKKTAPLNPTEVVPQKTTPQRQAGKAQHPEVQKQTKRFT